jgi:hypothetical protein
VPSSLSSLSFSLSRFFSLSCFGVGLLKFLGLPPLSEKGRRGRDGLVGICYTTSASDQIGSDRIRSELLWKERKERKKRNPSSSPFSFSAFVPLGEIGGGAM